MAARFLAVVLGGSNAAITAYWLVGGTALLSTVGGEIERWGRERSGWVLTVLAVVLVIKAALAGSPLMLGRLRSARRRRFGRGATWAAAVVLVLYGGLLTVAGLLVQFDVVHRSTSADDVALAWHAYLWDPWFLAWGLLVVVALVESRRRTRRSVRPA